MDSITESKPINPRYQLPAPMLLPVLFWVAGTVCGRSLAFSEIFHFLSAGTALAAAILFKRIRPLMILLLFFSFGALRYIGSQGKDSELIRIVREKGEVQQVAKYTVETQLAERVYQVRLKSIAGMPTRDRMLLFGSQDLTEGNIYQSLSRIELLSRDPILDIYPHRFTAQLIPVMPLEDLGTEARGQYVRNTRTWVQTRLDDALGPYSPLAKALLISDADFKRENRQELSRAGITHLIVVSGLHVAMLALIVMIILRFFLPLRIAELLFMIFLLFFAALNNWAPPIMRASLMICLWFASRWLSRPLSAAQSLSVALFIICLVKPDELFQLGLQLSFISVALITFVFTRQGGKEAGGLFARIARILLTYAQISLVVGLGIAPLTLYYFGSASLNGVLANLLGLPVITLLLGLSILCVFIPLPVFVLSFQAISDLWNLWMDQCARLPFYLDAYWISAAQAVALGIIILNILLAFRANKRTLQRLAIPSVILVLLLLMLPRHRGSELYFFNAGVADCSLILASDGSTLMIDTGGLSGSRAETLLGAHDSADSWMNRKLLVWLGRRGIRELDYLLITHLHSDHAGGLKSILASKSVKHLLISQNDLDSDIWNELATSLKLNGTQIIAIQDTMSFALGNSRLKILHPVSAFQDPDINNHSIVCRYDSPAGVFLFTGDIEREAEAWLVHTFPHELKSDVLKVAHHGSRGSSTDEFLQLVKPREALITASRKNVYGFPHSETLHRLKDQNCLIRYSYEGTIRYTAK